MQIAISKRPGPTGNRLYGLRFMPFIIFFSLISIALSSFCNAGTAHEEYKKIQKEINKHKEKLEEAKRRESSVLTEIENTNKQLKSTGADLRKCKEQLRNTEAKIARIESDISVYSGNISRHREWMKRKLQAIYKYGYSSDVVRLFLSADDISKITRSEKHLHYIVLYEHRMINNYKESLESLNQKEKQLKSLKAELTKNKERVHTEEEALAQKMKNKETLLVSVRKEEGSYKKMLKELKDASDRLLEIIRESEKEEKAETFTGKSLSSFKGKLPWPVDGKVAIPYGSQKDPQFNTPIFRSGAYIRADDNAYAKAVYNGKVVFAEWFKGYGQLVIVNHGDGYHTLYGSLSEIFTKVGDIIKGQQAVGRVGNSGILNSPGLYFELRYKGKPLDPLQWLKKR